MTKATMASDFRMTSPQSLFKNSPTPEQKRQYSSGHASDGQLCRKGGLEGRKPATLGLHHLGQERGNRFFDLVILADKIISA
jgi:hypothetical protein